MRCIGIDEAIEGREDQGLQTHTAERPRYEEAMVLVAVATTVEGRIIFMKLREISRGHRMGHLLCGGHWASGDWGWSGSIGGKCFPIFPDSRIFRISSLNIESHLCVHEWHHDDSSRGVSSISPFLFMFRLKYGCAMADKNSNCLKYPSI